MIKSKDSNLDLLKIDKKFYKNIDIYYIEFITMKYVDYVKIQIVNPLYLIVNKSDGWYIEENNGNKDSKNSFFLRIKTRKHWNSIQNFGIKLRIWFKKYRIDQVTMMINTWKTNLIQIMVYLWIKNQVFLTWQ